MQREYYHEYAAVEDTDWWFRARRRIIGEVLRSRLPPAGSREILDVGCGTGAMLELLQKFGIVEGLDNSDEALRFSRKRLGPAVAVHRGSLPDELPEGRTYDLVTAFDVLEHIADPTAALGAIRRLLKPTATFVCTVPAYEFLWGPHDEINEHFRRYRAGTLLSQMQEAGFDVAWHSYFNSVLFPPIAAVRTIRRWLPAGEVRSDLGRTPRVVGRLLEALFASERFWLARSRLPFGVSLMAMATPRAIDAVPRIAAEPAADEHRAELLDWPRPAPRREGVVHQT